MLDKLKDMFGRPRYCHLKRFNPGIRCESEMNGQCKESTLSIAYPCDYMRYEPMPINVDIKELAKRPSKGYRGTNK